MLKKKLSGVIGNFWRLVFYFLNKTVGSEAHENNFRVISS